MLPSLALGWRKLNLNSKRVGSVHLKAVSSSTAVSVSNVAKFQIQRPRDKIEPNKSINVQGDSSQVPTKKIYVSKTKDIINAQAPFPTAIQISACTNQNDASVTKSNIVADDTTKHAALNAQSKISSTNETTTLQVPSMKPSSTSPNTVNTMTSSESFSTTTVSANQIHSRLSSPRYKFRTDTATTTSTLSSTVPNTVHEVVSTPATIDSVDGIDDETTTTTIGPSRTATTSNPTTSTVATAASASLTGNAENTNNNNNGSNFLDRVHIVNTIEEAQYIISQLNQLDHSIIWACDTEVADIDIKTQGPVGNGHVVCVSIYGGPEVDFGRGKDKALWIENLNESNGILSLFKDWFENENIKKVWHNYGFDRHVIYNHDINCRGFLGDTMHMARLWDTSRDKISGGGGYSLEELSKELVQEKLFEKVSMVDIFGVPKLKKDGEESKIKVIPEIKELQINPIYRDKWIEYSAKDAIATWYLRQELQYKLENMDWYIDDLLQGNMYDFYLAYFAIFGEVLTDIERNGILLDIQNHLKLAEERAREDKKIKEKLFIDWAITQCKDAIYMNTASASQLQHFFFGQYTNRKKQGDDYKIFKIDKTEEEYQIEENILLSQNPYANHTIDELKVVLKSRKLKATGKKSDLFTRLLQNDINEKRLLDLEAGLLIAPSRSSTAAAAADTVVDSSVYKSATNMYDVDSSTPSSSSSSSYSTTSVIPQSYDNINFITAEMDTTVDKLSTRTSSKPSSSSSSSSFSLSAGGITPSNMATFPMNDISRRHMRMGRKSTPLSTSYSTSSSSSSSTELNAVTSSSIYEEESIVTNIPIETEETMIVSADSTTAEGKKPKKVKKEKKPKVVKEIILTPFELHDKILHEKYGYTEEEIIEIHQKDQILIDSILNVKSKVSKFKEISLKSMHFEPIDFTPGGLPQVSTSVLRKLAGKNLNDENPQWGTVYEHLGAGDYAAKACRAIDALADIGQIDSTITNFLVPLQALVDKNGRIHCSLNLNTETGRLSSRRPNLQNQPALEKDPYKIRDAFVAEPGKTLIVADYGQLELRIMAHMTNCKSMLDAFASGGCFHSRTAVGMYPHIREAIEQGQVLLEWDYSKGKPPAPLVKDKYASERRKAKTLNFSIAYGKTVHGLAEDWGITTEEAEKTLEAWYSDRPEVKEWQQKTQAMAVEKGKVYTIMGRHRNLYDAMKFGDKERLRSVELMNKIKTMKKNKNRRKAMSEEEQEMDQETLEALEIEHAELTEARRKKNHALRAAINTPIQGSAADIVMMAMIKLYRSNILERLGWKLLLQIHDEVILEGPVESREEALAEVINCMENPFDGKALSSLRVHLAVDAKSADSWYQAK